MNDREVAPLEPLKDVNTQQEMRLGTDVEQVIPVIREELSVQVHKYITGIVRVKKIVGQRRESIDQPIHHTKFLVERIAINKIMSEPPPVREEGDTTIFSVVEEVLVTMTQYLVKEEVRISRQHSQVPRHESFLLRTEDVVIEREPVMHPSKV